MANSSIDWRIRAPKSKAEAKARHWPGLLTMGALISRRAGSGSGRRAGAPAMRPRCASTTSGCSPSWAERRARRRTAIQVPPTATSTPGAPRSAAWPVPASTFIVTTAADIVNPGDGKLSLREAVASANGTAALDAIGFAPSLEGQTLVLTGGQLTVSQDLIIDGNGDDGGAAVTIDGDDTSRVLLIGGTGTDVVLRDLGIVGGYSHDTDGGGMTAWRRQQPAADRGRGSRQPELGGSVLGYASGGGIAADANSRLAVSGSTITGNVAWGDYECGGGIFAAEGSAVASSATAR